MKLYGYAILKIYNKNNDCNIRKIAFSYSVKETPGAYTNADAKKFYSPWDNYFPKDEIGKVQKDVYGTNMKYLVYLLEDDKSKAMSLIKSAIQIEIDELDKQMALKQELLGVTCGSVSEIEEL